MDLNEEIHETGHPYGEFQDRLVAPDGRLVFCQPWQRNLITDRLRQVMAALLKGDSQGVPLAYWAVGRGEDGWDGGAVPPDTTRRSYVKLVNETGRKAISPAQISFVGGSFTNRLQITAEFIVTDISGSDKHLREFGLFAGGSSTVDSGNLINHRIHPRIDMQAGFTLQRTLRITF